MQCQHIYRCQLLWFELQLSHFPAGCPNLSKLHFAHLYTRNNSLLWGNHVLLYLQGTSVHQARSPLIFITNAPAQACWKSNLSRGLPWPDVCREVKTNNSQWLWHCFLPLSWCPPWASGQAFSGWFFYWKLTTSGHHFGKFYIRTYCFKSLELPSCSFYLCNNGHPFRRTWELPEV